jgi:hypothetical protein
MSSSMISPAVLGAGNGRAIFSSADGSSDADLVTTWKRGDVVHIQIVSKTTTHINSSPLGARMQAATIIRQHRAATALIKSCRFWKAMLDSPRMLRRMIGRGKDLHLQQVFTLARRAELGHSQSPISIRLGNVNYMRRGLF